MNREGYVPSIEGTPLYFKVVGAGEPAILLCDGVGCAGYAWRYFVDYFRDRHRIAHWHYRGHGRSGKPRDLSRLEIADHADDAVRVLAEVGAKQAVLVGHSMGVQVILEIYRRHPQRVRGLVPICGSYGHVIDTFHGTQVLKRLFPVLYRLSTSEISRPLVQAFWTWALHTRLAYTVAALVEINPRLVREEDFRPYLDHLGAMDVEVFVRCLDGASRHSAEDLLPSVRVPTLIVAGERDGFTPSWLSEKMHREIPGAEILRLPGGTHTSPIELPDLVNLRVEKFLLEHFAGALAAAAQ